MSQHADPDPDWWSRRRLRYNLYFVGSILFGFISYQIILHVFKTTIGHPYVNPDGTPTGVYDIDVDDAPFGGCAEVCGIGIVILLANLCYFLGHAIERFVPASAVPRYRSVSWWAGTLFSCAPPLAIPTLHLAFCLFSPDSYGRTPIVFPDTTAVPPATKPTSAPTTQRGNGGAG